MNQTHCHSCGGIVTDLSRIEYRPPRASAQMATPHGGACECRRSVVYEDPPIVDQPPPEAGAGT